jgi:hypothetical protein
MRVCSVSCVCMASSSPRSVLTPAVSEWPGRDTQNLRQTLITSKRSLEARTVDRPDIDWPGRPVKHLKQTVLVFHTRVAGKSQRKDCP